MFGVWLLVGLAVVRVLVCLLVWAHVEHPPLCKVYYGVVSGVGRHERGKRQILGDSAHTQTYTVGGFATTQPHHRRGFVKR
jgi:hypothetical protein